MTPKDNHSAGSSRLRRCRATIAGEPADRAPVYIPAIACGVSSEMLHRAAVTGTGSLHFAEVAAWADGPRAHEEFQHRLVEDLVAIHRALDADVLRMPWRMNRRPAARIDQNTFVFGDPEAVHEIWRYDPQTADFGLARRIGEPPPARQRCLEEIQAAEAGRDTGAPPPESQLGGLAMLREAAGDDFLVIGATAGITVGLAADDLMLLVTDPDLLARRAMLQAARAVALGEALVAAGLPPVILGGGDLAGAAGPMYSPASFREVLLPAYTWAIRRLDRLGVHYVFRSDGDLWPLMDMLFAEAGCSGFGEADRDAGMTVGAVRERFADLVIWGNVSSVTLTHGSPEDVRRQAEQILAESGGRGYFQGCSNAIVAGTPPANVEAMLSARRA